MKKLIKLMSMLMIAGLVSMMAFSCSKDESAASKNIEGEWYGISTYYNPAGGTKYRYLTMTFESGRGTLVFESPVVNGNQKCSDFGNSECSIFGIKTTVFSASVVQ